MPQSKKPPSDELDELVDLGLAAPQDAEVHFDNAYRIRKVYGQLVGARKANRDSLRALEVQGVLTDEQREELDELYPPRIKAEDDADDAATEPQEAAA